VCENRADLTQPGSCQRFAKRIVRLCGRCARGERMVGYVPLGNWKITYVAAQRGHGMAASHIIDGAITGKPKDILMIDSPPAHNAAGVREAIEAGGATVRYLSKYSPDVTN
jgi:hypothetical protein